jgi:hypothetical protein
MASRGGDRRFRFVAVAAAAAVAVAGIAAGLVASGTGDAAPGMSRLSATPLGVNVAPWDAVYTSGGGLGVVQPLLRAAGVNLLRYGGGSYSDYYNWQTNTNIGGCLPGNATASFTAGCAGGDPLSFATFSQQARQLGAASFVTVNYGSGTPELAASWVAEAGRTPGEQVARWEVGNENYGCWEVNNPLTGPPANVHGYQPQLANSPGQNCPQSTQDAAAGTRTLATSYAVNALPFLRAMKAADPAAKIGVPWAFGSVVQGSAVPGNGTWNDTVLGTDGAYVSFVDAHYYPFTFSGATGGGNPTDEQVLRALRTIPALAQSMKSGLSAHGVPAEFVIGETAVSNNPTSTACSPAGTVFAAGDVLSWLAAGAASVDWWDLNNYGNTGTSCSSPDFGFFTSSMSSPVPQSAYYGYLLASQLARPGAEFGTLATSDPSDVLAFQAALPDGGHAVAFLNLDAGAGHTVTFAAPDGLSGDLQTSTYSGGQQNSSNSEIVLGSMSTAGAAGGLQLPAESVTILRTS